MGSLEVEAEPSALFCSDRGLEAELDLVLFDRAGRETYRYAKCHLTAADRQWFTPGDAVALFEVEGVPATAILCHERRYPELVRLGVMAGARIIFHPNAGMDPLAVSSRKRGGRDGIAVRAFDSSAETFADFAALETYVDATSGAVMRNHHPQQPDC